MRFAALADPVSTECKALCVYVQLVECSALEWNFCVVRPADVYMDLVVFLGRTGNDECVGCITIGAVVHDGLRGVPDHCSYRRSADGPCNVPVELHPGLRGAHCPR